MTIIITQQETVRNPAKLHPPFLATRGLRNASLPQSMDMEIRARWRALVEAFFYHNPAAANINQVAETGKASTR